MTTAKNRPPSDRGQGRKPIKVGVETVVVGVRMLPEQRDRLKVLGGSNWVRDMIDKSKPKSGAKSKK